MLLNFIAKTVIQRRFKYVLVRFPHYCSTNRINYCTGVDNGQDRHASSTASSDVPLDKKAHSFQLRRHLLPILKEMRMNQSPKLLLNSTESDSQKSSESMSLNKLRMAQPKINLLRRHPPRLKLPSYFGEPKPPTRPFPHFIQTRRVKGVTIQALKEDWNNLSVEEKQKYHDKFIAENATYKEKLAEWTKKMIADGRINDLIAIRTEREKRRAQFTLKRLRAKVSAARIMMRPSVKIANYAISPSAKNFIASQVEFATGIKYKLKNNKTMKPQRPPSAKTLFFNDFFASQPKYRGHSQAAQLAWNTLSDERKQEYEALHATQMQMYFDDMKAWRGVALSKGLSGALTTAAEEVAGACGKPKKPVRGRERFISKFFSKQQIDVADSTERFQAANAAWDVLDDAEKENYTKQYEDDMSNYKEALLEWQKKMLVEGHLSLLSDKAKKELAAAFGEPKRPLSAFARFVQAETMVTLKDFKKAASAWDSLSEDEKQKYRESYTEEFMVYIMQLEKWRKKMIVEGYGNLVPDRYKKLHGDVEQLACEAKLETWKKDMVAEGRHDVLFKMRSEQQQWATLANKPKAPDGPFKRFLRTIRAPKNEKGGLLRVGSQAWKVLPDEEKEKYLAEFYADQIEYKEKLMAWKKNMIDQGQEDVLLKMKRMRTERYRSFDMPKKPAPINTQFLKDFFVKNPKMRYGDKRERLITAHSAWHALRKEERKKYEEQFSVAQAEYKSALEKWRVRMIRNGVRFGVRFKDPKRKFLIAARWQARQEAKNEDDTKAIMEAVMQKREDGQPLNPVQAHIIIETAKRDRRQHVQRLYNYGMPKKPDSPYFLYLKETNLRTTLDWRRRSVTWVLMDKEKKRKYIDKAAVELERYKKELEEWKSKMIESGNEDACHYLGILPSENNDK